MKIIHIITALEDGGTEKVLFNICKYDKKNQHIVISLKDSGKYFHKLKKINIEVYSLKMKSLFFFIEFFSLARLIYSAKPDIVQTWLPHADFFGGCAALMVGIKNIIWNVRYSKLKKSTVNLNVIFLIKILSKLSFLIPKKIIVVSKSALINCKKLGYCKNKLHLIQNGYDFSIFNAYKQKNYLKKRFKLKKNTYIIGLVGRYDPTKDHKNLLKALCLLREKKFNFNCFLIGSRINNKILAAEVNNLKLKNYVKLLGEKNNIYKFIKGMDLHVLSSKTEGFPNVLAEAMALKIPCVATNVGDSSYIIGKTGWIVPPNNSKKLAQAIESAFLEIGNKNWKNRCNQASLRIKNNFEITKMIKSYNSTWQNVQIK